MAYLSDDLLSYLKLVDFSTTAQTQLSNAEILSIADNTLLLRILPHLIRINEGYTLVKEDFPFVASKAKYALPKYAMFNIIHFVERISNGMSYRLQPVPSERTYMRYDSQTGDPQMYDFIGNYIEFYPPPQTSASSYRMQYYRRPGRLVETSAAAKILSVNKVNGEVTYTAVPPSTFTASSTHDFYSSTSPFVRLNTNVTATAIAANVQTFPVASVQDLSPNDYVCLLDETVYPDLPIELYDFFAELIVLRLAKIQNDKTKYQYTDKEVQERIETLYAVIGQRHDAQSFDVDLLNNPFTTGWFGF